MDGQTQVVACFVIYSDDEISCQGSFQVDETLHTSTFQSTDGGDFSFTHCFSGTLCDLEVKYSQASSVLAQCKLTVPINRSKIKWKQQDLNDHLTVHYRCQLEDWSKGKLRKERNKLRRQAVLRGTTAKAIIFYKIE